jgi:hypothetical protein
LLLLIPSTHAATMDWVRAGETTNSPMWGIRGGLQFALHPGGFTRGEGGPRGLIRLGYPTLTNGGYDLINFIAVEPVVNGKKGFSELEKSSLDQRNGKVFWTGDATPPAAGQSRLDAGTLTWPEPGVSELSVAVFVEKFDNGAKVRFRLAQRSDAPDELRLTVDAETDSAPLETCSLTATMGNKARIRRLFLRDGPVSSLQLYPDFRGREFAPHHIFELDRLPRASNGDVLVTVATDEANPAAARPFGRPHFWDYLGVPVTQYWRRPAGEVRPALTCGVNARFTYWTTDRPIPGGIAFENFELREPFRPGQTYIFGITRHVVEAK